MFDIMIATGNRHKFKELRRLLRLPGIRWRSLTDVPGAPSVKEDGRTFEENATKKAVAVARATGGLVLADDSGIEVDALSGSPGIRSARFAGAHGDDQRNNEKLLRLLGDAPVSQRGARYVCVLALADCSGLLATARGTWRGRIACQSKGRHGFGYDPIFLVPRFGKTVGQLSAATKRRFSHRAVAARRMRTTLVRLLRERRGLARVATPTSP